MCAQILLGLIFVAVPAHEISPQQKFLLVRYLQIFLLYTLIGNQLETPTSCLSQAFGMEHGGVPRKRKPFVRFTEYQLSELKKRFKSDPYIKGIEKELMAKNLGTTQTAVQRWFKVEHMKLKRNLPNEASNVTVVTA